MSSLSGAVSAVVRDDISLQCSAHEYQALMQDGRLSSQDLVNCFLGQIERHNGLGLKLKAVLSVSPRDVLISQAKVLDEERRQGKVRSELHGIPIIIKVAQTLSNKWLKKLTDMTRTVLSRIRPWEWSLRQARVLLHHSKRLGTQA
ncbi:hypothetical protein diail_11031 [Diaporthe ilicicola]|nr:hypothetical protein diail_11031 [Diaporthe ilicicola]